MTFGGDGGFAKIGSSDRAAAIRQIDLCLDAGVNLLDTADAYASSEDIWARHSGRGGHGC